MMAVEDEDCDSNAHLNLWLGHFGFAKSLISVLDTVSTTRDSGWVADRTCDIANDFESE
jgi:hypothetical protein